MENSEKGDQLAEKPVEQDAVERDLYINGVKVHIKSIFTGKTILNNAMSNIVSRKLTESKN